MDNQWWTPERVDAARAELANFPKVCKQALEAIGDRLDREVTADALQKAFKRQGLMAPSSYCRSPLRERVEIDPVEAQVKREEQSRDKKTIAELVARLREAEARHEFFEAVDSCREPPSVMPRERNSGLREMTSVVLASDWHVEELVEPQTVAFRNQYNLEIAEKRMGRFFNAAIWNVEHHRASERILIRDMVLWLGGDLITGYIHEELMESNQLSPIEAVIWLVPRLCRGIRSILHHLELESLTIPCSGGNHGRSTQKKRIATGYKNSFEYLLYKWLESEFKDEPRVRFEATGSAHQYVNVYGRTLHFTHGDEVKYGGGVGGITIPLLKAVPMWDLVKRADVHNLGHFHQLTDLGRVVVNSSLIGYGPFSQSIRAPYEPPQQAAYFVDSKRGKCMTTALWVDEDEQVAA